MTIHISGATRLVCLFGCPVEHSISPQIHNLAFKELKLPFAYIPVNVPRGKLYTAVQMLRSCSMAGANVTIPHKQQIINYCDILSPLSARIGAVNTLYFRDNLLIGTTTDPEGFLAAVRSMGHEPSGSRIVVLGNGGTSRTLAYSLAIDKVPASLTLAGRSPGKVKALAAEIAASTGMEIKAFGIEEPGLGDALKSCSLLVNCTSAGMHPDINSTPLDKKFFHSGMTVFDTVYNPAQTRFLREAAEMGCRVQNGMKMLLYQGLASSKLWTGVAVPETIFDIDKMHEWVNNK